MSADEPVEVAAWLHAEHLREFTWLAGTDLTDPVPVDECGNCQRWARYAQAAIVSPEHSPDVIASLVAAGHQRAMLDALTADGTLKYVATNRDGSRVWLSEETP